MNEDDALNEAARLNSLAQTEEHGSLGPLEDLWARSPGLLDSLPFMGTGDQAEAARAYVYSSGIWLAQAQAVYPKVQADEDTGGLLAANIQRTLDHREFLMRLGYKPSLDGATGALADLAKKVKDNSPSGWSLGLAAVGVILVLAAILVVRR